jgi:LCP family protein required for cell wall assembly
MSDLFLPPSGQQPAQKAVEETQVLTESAGGGDAAAGQGTAAQDVVAKAKKKRRWILPLGISVGVLIIALLAGVAWVWSAANSALDKIERDPALVIDDPDFPAPLPSELIERHPLNIVIMGSDSRGDIEDGRSDVLLVMHVTADRDKMYLISFPRDMYVSIPGHGKNKINAAYAFGGAPLTVKTLQKLVGVGMDHTVVIDFESFVQITKVIGGVTFNNSFESTNLGYHFPKGQVTMSGDELLAYVRQRRGLPGGDLGRTERHRTVLRAVFLKLATPETLTNPTAIQSVVDEVGGYFTVDARLTNSEIISIGTSLRLSKGADVIGLQAPVSGYGRTKANAAIDIVDEKQMAALAKAIQEDSLDTYIEKYGTASGLTKR